MESTRSDVDPSFSPLASSSSRGNGRNFSFSLESPSLVRSFNIFLSTPKPSSNDSIPQSRLQPNSTFFFPFLSSPSAISERGKSCWLLEISYHPTDFVYGPFFPFFSPRQGSKISFRNKIGNLISINATHFPRRSFSEGPNCCFWCLNKRKENSICIQRYSTKDWKVFALKIRVEAAGVFSCRKR